MSAYGVNTGGKCIRLTLLLDMFDPKSYENPATDTR